MTTTMSNTLTSAPLSAALKVATSTAHERAEHSTFTQDLMKGNLNQAAFIDLQIQSWFIYNALERAARAVAGDPLAEGVCDPALERVDSLAADLAIMCGNTWADKATMLPATEAYCQRLADIECRRDAVLLVAHHYVRYLGDLSGGQIIARMMQRHYDTPKQCLSFYTFAGIPKVKPYKDRYRAALDALPLTDADRNRLLEEAVEAFVYNFAMFADLGRLHPRVDG